MTFTNTQSPGTTFGITWGRGEESEGSKFAFDTCFSENSFLMCSANVVSSSAFSISEEKAGSLNALPCTISNGVNPLSVGAIRMYSSLPCRLFFPPDLHFEGDKRSGFSVVFVSVLPSVVPLRLQNERRYRCIVFQEYHVVGLCFYTALWPQLEHWHV